MVLGFGLVAFDELLLFSSLQLILVLLSKESTTSRQIDLKKIIAFFPIAHINLVTIGMSSQAAAIWSPILSYEHTSKAKTCVLGMRPINLLAIGEKT